VLSRAFLLYYEIGTPICTALSLFIATPSQALVFRTCEACKMGTAKSYTAAEHQLTQILLTELLAYVTPSRTAEVPWPRICFLTS
jgi:hypothetical protein